ncbi:MAG: type I glutamate--ammonia ligase [Clostridia bacterium]
MKNIEELKKFCESNSVQMIDFKVTDIDGRLRHITIPAKRFTEDTLKYGIGFDGSNYGYAPVENSDMVLIPDLSTAVLEPFAEIATISMMGDAMIIKNPENLPFDQYPRNVIRSAAKYMKELDIADKMIIGPEFEFYVFDSMQYQVQPNHVSYDLEFEQAEWSSNVADANAGYHTAKKAAYHIAPPCDSTFDLRNEICAMLEEMDIGVKYHHHEVGGSGQLEIEVQLDDVIKMADNTMMIKYIIQNMAKNYGVTATFMPKPIAGEPGSGMHVHMLLQKDGKPLFHSETGYANLSETALYFIGGLLKHMHSLCAITNPSTNSFRRLVPGFEAPVTIGYATANRSAVVRIPAYAKSPEVKRFELRNPDATCNPYYAYAAILMAGIDGIRNKIDPSKQGWGPYDFNLFDLSDEEKAKIDTLPTHLDAALEALKNDHDYLTAGGVFPQRLIDTWLKRKGQECEEIERIPHPSEFSHYYNL